MEGKQPAGMLVEVIVATYKNPTALGLTLATLGQQHGPDFSICVAEDAEDPETSAAIAAAKTGRALRHIRQRDEGFRKNRILNAAIASSKAEYLVFVDGDCLLHPKFVARHCACARPDRYLSGGLIRLSGKLTQALLTDPGPVLSGQIWQRRWLQEAGLWGQLRHRIKLIPDRAGPVLDRLSLARKRWLGANASAFRTALYKVNGFDTGLDYGAEDKELGVRLENAGIRPHTIRYSAPALHLDHSRGYVTEQRNSANLALIRSHKASKVHVTPNGLVELAPNAGMERER